MLASRATRSFGTVAMYSTRNSRADICRTPPAIAALAAELTSVGVAAGEVPVGGYTRVASGTAGCRNLASEGVGRAGRVRQAGRRAWLPAETTAHRSS
jgi:hypothetical protein